MYDTTTADDDSNGESVLKGSKLNVNVVAARKARPTSILKGKSSRKKKLYKSSEMPAGAVPKMMTSKQLEVRDPVTNELVSYMTYAAKMATIDYSRCDSLVLIEESAVDLHYKVNLHNSYEMEYRANMSKQDRVVGGKHLALVDSRANGGIIGRDMRIIYFNPDERQVSIGIAGDHQLTGNILCCGCSVAKSNLGWIKLLWAQGAQVNTQQNSIISVIQMRDIGCVVNDVAKAHGGQQMMLTPGGVQLPSIIKNGLPYLEHVYVTAKQMEDITREEFMMSRNK